MRWNWKGWLFPAPRNLIKLVIVVLLVLAIAVGVLLLAQAQSPKVYYNIPPSFGQ